MGLAMILLGIFIGTAYFFTAGTESVIENFRYLILASSVLDLPLVYSSRHQLISEFKVDGKWTNENIKNVLKNAPLTLRQRTLLLTLITSLLLVCLLVGVMAGIVFGIHIIKKNMKSNFRFAAVRALSI